ARLPGAERREAPGGRGVRGAPAGPRSRTRDKEDEMTRGDRRIEKLYDYLGPKERAALLLQSWHTDGTKDPRLDESTPEHQVPLVAHCLNVLRAGGGALHWYALWLDSRLETLL